ncbi:hypothetical protein CEXT_206961 [Caerostris extrusa]|uniref:Uncharacterized protein n=1 Tax=Caerostris extrusa TaxID=172846 RepID=A0AAV4Q4T0_CAEEX|nr:hypothetical protein CEXT_206961 [Caerostris extrusa]
MGNPFSAATLLPPEREKKNYRDEENIVIKKDVFALLAASSEKKEKKRQTCSSAYKNKYWTATSNPARHCITWICEVVEMVLREIAWCIPEKERSSRPKGDVAKPD